MNLSGLCGRRLRRNHRARIEAGEAIGFLEDHAVRKWDLAALTNKMDEAVAFFKRNLVDGDGLPQNLSDDAVLEFLDEIGQSLNYNGLASRRKVPGTGSSHRKIHLLNADAEVKAHELFGQGTFIENWVDDMEMATRSRVMSENYGPLWRSDSQGIRRTMKDISESSVDKGLTKAKVTLTNVEFDRYYEGTFLSSGPSPVPNMHLAVRTAMAMNNIRLLGKIPLYALSDWGASAFNTRAFKNGGFVNMLDALQEVTRNYDGDLKRVLDNALMLSDFEFAAVGRVMPFDINNPLPSGGAKFLHSAARHSQTGANWVGKLTLANAIAKKTMQAHTLLYLREFAHYAGKSFDELAKADKVLHGRLSDAGISSSMWSKIAREDNVVNGALDISKVKDLDVAARVSGFLNHESYYSVIRPDAATRHFLTKMGNDVSGSAFALAFQYRSFQIQMFRGPIKRAYNEGGVLNVARLALPMTVAGMAIVQLNQILDGKDVYSYETPLLWLSGVDKSGILGIFSGLVSYTGGSLITGKKARQVRLTWQHIRANIGVSCGPYVLSV